MKVINSSLQEAIEEAKAASKRSYSPYSKFRVGSAVITEDGEIFAGCNVENASYGLTMCAERNAVAQAVAKGNEHIKIVVVYTPTEEPITPCGACRQVIIELGPDAEIVCVCDGPKRIRKKIFELLPESFGKEIQK